MDALTAAGLVAAGLIFLAGGGEALVRAATTLAGIAGVSPAVIGLTVVAIGTSLPELVVSLMAAAEGQPDLSVANVVGSNIFNIAATLGLTALIIPLPVEGSAVRLEWPVMLGSSLLLVLVAQNGEIGRMEGAVFVVALASFVAFTVRIARRSAGPAEQRQFAEHAESRDLDAVDAAGKKREPTLTVAVGVLLVGMVGLLVGGRLLVDGAIALARIAGMTERVIGLTIVAAGTGAPELATSLVAALRKRTDIAVANMIGSNIFNVLGILGVTALVTPVRVAPAILHSDVWWMIGTTLLLLPLMRSGSRLSRPEGAVLVAVYITYIVTLLRG